MCANWSEGGDFTYKRPMLVSLRYVVRALQLASGKKKLLRRILLFLLQAAARIVFLGEDTEAAIGCRVGGYHIMRSCMGPGRLEGCG